MKIVICVHIDGDWECGSHTEYLTLEAESIEAAHYEFINAIQTTVDLKKENQAKADAFYLGLAKKEKRASKQELQEMQLAKWEFDRTMPYTDVFYFRGSPIDLSLFTEYDEKGQIQVRQNHLSFITLDEWFMQRSKNF